ncbi:MAG TPA: DUF1015 family protein [Bryobacteraceae bacterium]|nr:DUF1015 family protein [Bryobacteraceae bacterium]
MAVLLPFQAFRSRNPTVHIPGEDAQPIAEKAEYFQDAQPALFHYRQRFRFPGEYVESFRDGIMGLLDRGAATVFPHEETTPDRVSGCRRMLELSAGDPGSLWLWCDDSEGALTAQLETTSSPEIEIEDRFGCLHQIWPVTGLHRIRAIQAALHGKAFFLADGHHRFAAGWNLATIQIRSQALRTHASHRVVLDAGELCLPASQPVEDIDRYLAGPAAGYSRCVVVTPGPVFRGIEVPSGVHIQKLLHNATVLPMRERSQAIHAVESGKAGMALLVAPFTLEQIESQASRGLLLPPKSTDFYPKLAAGLIVHRPQNENVTPPVVQRPGVR